MLRLKSELTRWVLAVVLTVTSVPAVASTFFGWQVAGVPSGDLLNVAPIQVTDLRCWWGMRTGRP
jgi:hypothetical protein